MEKFDYRNIEPTYSDTLTYQKKLVANCLGHAFEGNETFLFHTSEYAFGGDFEQFRQAAQFRKPYGMANISNEGLTCITFYWTEFPQKAKPSSDDICLVKPFILYPKIEWSQVIFEEKNFIKMDPKRYFDIRRNPNPLALELYREA